jgi:hypothetical protein
MSAESARYFTGAGNYSCVSSIFAIHGGHAGTTKPVLDLIQYPARRCFSLNISTIRI